MWTSPCVVHYQGISNWFSTPLHLSVREKIVFFVCLGLGFLARAQRARAGPSDALITEAERIGSVRMTGQVPLGQHSSGWFIRPAGGWLEDGAIWKPLDRKPTGMLCTLQYELGICYAKGFQLPRQRLQNSSAFRYFLVDAIELRGKEPYYLINVCVWHAMGRTL